MSPNEAVDGGIGLSLQLNSQQAADFIDQLIGDEEFLIRFNERPEAALADFGISAALTDSSGDAEGAFLSLDDVRQVVAAVTYVPRPRPNPPAFGGCSRIGILAYVTAAAGREEM